MILKRGTTISYSTNCREVVGGGSGSASRSTTRNVDVHEFPQVFTSCAPHVRSSMSPPLLDFNDKSQLACSFAPMGATFSRYLLCPAPILHDPASL